MKVLHNVGLCISVYDLLEIFDAFVYQGEGSPFVKVKFRLLVFRPFEGEILIGKIRACTELGVHVSLKFFDDIIINPINLQPDTFFDFKEQVWVWNYQNEKLFMDVNEPIRFRVFSDYFIETPPISKENLLAKFTNASEPTPIPLVTESTKPAPYSVIGSICEDGLGLLSWWRQ